MNKKRENIPWKVFGTIVLAAATVAGAVQMTIAQRYRPNDEETKLTPNEKALVTSIFGDELDPDSIRIRAHEQTEKTTAMSVSTATPHRIDVWGRKHNRADYAQDENGIHYRIFVHELTHVWQFKKNPATPLCSEYKYEVLAYNRSLDYCNEQQASMVGDYAGRFHHPARIAPYNNKGCTGPFNRNCDQRQDELLKKAVEEQFPAARITRLAREMK